MQSAEELVQHPEAIQRPHAIDAQRGQRGAEAAHASSASRSCPGRVSCAAAAIVSYAPRGHAPCGPSIVVVLVLSQMAVDDEAHRWWFFSRRRDPNIERANPGRSGGCCTCPNLRAVQQRRICALSFGGGPTSSTATPATTTSSAATATASLLPLSLCGRRHHSCLEEVKKLVSLDALLAAVVGRADAVHSRDMCVQGWQKGGSY